MLLKKAVVATRGAIAFSLAALFAMPVWAINGSATVTGGEVQFFGATETNWLNGTELLLKFEGEGSFVLPGQTKARILAIGGGGGGGGVYSAADAMTGSYAAGGGGGAGGFVEVTNVYAAATYSVVVGNGGLGGASYDLDYNDGLFTGGTGGNTTLSTNKIDIITAYGGGGGGGSGVGLDGGSGGGGSRFLDIKTARNRAGGSVRAEAQGQGYGGGNGNKNLWAGGGGGAGGVGKAASATGGGIGGIGRASDIACKDGEDPILYAGGGAGGYCNKAETSTTHAPIPGGEGGGGSGGYGLNVPCTDGTFYGGGGGGCGAVAVGSTTPGGSGYRGVMYVRILVVATGDIVKPKSQSVPFDGNEHVLVPWNAAYEIVDLTPGSATSNKVVNSVSGTESGTYKAKVTLTDGFKWSDGTTDKEVIVTLTIEKATPVISNLSVLDWIKGTPAEFLPEPGCDVSLFGVSAKYYWSSSPEPESWTPWSEGRPTDVGTYYLRAHIEKTDSYNSAETNVSFRVIEGRGDIYRDYVDITIAGADVETNDFTYVLKLSEGQPSLGDQNPVGFLYSRAGRSGEELAVTDDNGNQLEYKVGNWYTYGESTIYVKLPKLLKTSQKIRLFWCVRDGASPLPYTGEVDDPTAASPKCKFDLVVRDGKRVNYWLEYPVISPDKWDYFFDTPGKVESIGKVQEGSVALLYVMNLNTGEVVTNQDRSATSPDITKGLNITEDGGSFSAVFGPNDPAGAYERIDYQVDFFVIGHPAYYDLYGVYSNEVNRLTLNGRVLLANDDSAPGGYAVNGQAYDSVGTTYWEHFPTNSEDYAETKRDVYKEYKHLKVGTEHTLYRKESEEQSTVLWELQDVYIGNLLMGDSTMHPSRCYLPNSTDAEQCNLVMRNSLAATVYSPTYTNGVGTVYFDIVNSVTDSDFPGSYKIKVEVSVDGGEFVPKPMNPFKCEGTPYLVADQTGTTELALEITSTGTADYFYRVAVPLDISGNVRFRIVRSAAIDEQIRIKDSNFIILDNILVSYPRAKASLEPYGKYDHGRAGGQVLGWGGAMDVPFPAVGDTVHARAKDIVVTNADSHVEVELPIPWAQMHYRWRYLGQQVDDWMQVGLRPTAGFVSPNPLYHGRAAPDSEGDVEFWYEYIIQVPAYRYHDYSGLNIGLNGDDGRALYSEDVTYCTNTQDRAEYHYEELPSGGSDWFFRLRRGRSEWESFTLYVKEKEDESGAGTPCEMTIAGNHVWRGLYPMRNELADGIYVRIAGTNRQTPGATDYSVNTNRYSLSGDFGSLPASGFLSKSDDDDGWVWHKVPCDAVSGYVLVQLQDDSLAYTVAHADYQGFNKWYNANKNDGKGLFVGTSSDTNSPYMSGATIKTKTHEDKFDMWNETQATSPFWKESFPATASEIVNWKLYEPFVTTNSPNQAFTVSFGQWVNGFYRDNNSEVALQMKGNGEGSVQFVNSAESPRGLEMMTFKARVAQAVEFDDFCYFMTDPTSLTNYTFMTAAAFDENSRKDFAGNGTLSIVAFYTPGVGCYELRVQQESAKFDTGQPDKVIGPGTKFRFSLYRWSYDEESDEVVAELLGEECDTNTDSANYFNTTAAKGNYGRMFISVDSSFKNSKGDAETRIAAGVSLNSVNKDNFDSGVEKFRVLMYRDSTSKRLSYGSYGLLSANCPASFMRPVLGSYIDTYTRESTDADKENEGPDLANYLAKSPENPSPEVFAKKNSENWGSYKLRPVKSPNAMKMASDIKNKRWKPVRARISENDDYEASGWYGFHAVIPSTTLNVYTAPAGTTEWPAKPLKTVEVSGFGSSTNAGNVTTIPLYSMEEVSVKICTGGTPKSARKDVTIDDIEFRQWRGESYNDDNQRKVLDNDMIRFGSYTNIVFTQGWVSNGVDSANNPRKTCLLSARRSYSNVATSIRSPRMVDDETGEGLGLGSLSFTYENAQTNAFLCVQVATGDMSPSSFADLTKSTSSAYWETVTNIDFSAKTMTDADRKSGSVRVYLGRRGIKGVMRIALDPARVAQVANETNETAFGEVTITSVTFSDEPKLDNRSWWGWNMRTTDDEGMRILSDNAVSKDAVGLSFGLNNSVSADIRDDAAETPDRYKEKLPFVQSPTFVTNLVNEISFMARLYSTNDPVARVSLFGLKSEADPADEKSWKWLAAWDVSNATYRAYSKNLGANGFYSSFRLAVTGVDGVVNPMQDDNPKPAPAGSPYRVLVDEVFVMGGIVPKVSFANVGAFRFGLDEDVPSEDVPSERQQPLVGEEWGVQCEIYASQLSDEINLSNAVVRLWWHEGVVPWGFEKWKDTAAAKGNFAQMARCSETSNVYRSSYFKAPGAVMKAQQSRATVQYMLEVVYDANETQQTNWLSSVDWQNPEWYNPMDCNEKYGGAFSAYTILDTVAPGWAWINEVNIFGERDDFGQNSDVALQFVEIAAPVDADLSGWRLRVLDARMGGSPIVLNEVVTNDVAVFGEGDLRGKKEGAKGMDEKSKMVFHVIGSPAARGSLSAEDGRYDGSWSFKNATMSVTDGVIQYYYPIGLQLVRPSGVVEHEIVAIGTNRWSYSASYNPEKAAELLSANERGGRFAYVGMDSAGVPEGEVWSRSLGVFADNGKCPMQWSNATNMTPGRINGGQVMPSGVPTPRGSALVIYSILRGEHLFQTFGEYENTSNAVTLVYRKGSEEATNITYRTDSWFEIDAVTTNGVAVVPHPTGNDREWILPVGANASNDVTIVASARLQRKLVDDYGLGPDNRYTEAVVKWLLGKKTHARSSSGTGEAFHNPDATRLGLAHLYVPFTESFVTNLTLTEMYWLDMDPTWEDGDIRLMAGWAPGGTPKTFSSADSDYNIKCTIYMQITNRNNGDFWAPYILQGTDFAGNSWDYAKPSSQWMWTNATFKIMGLLQVNGIDKTNYDVSNLIPLQGFIFVEDSFDANFTSYIEIVDPYSKESPGWNYGWYDWAQEHPECKTSGFFLWHLTDRGLPRSPKILKKENPL